MAKKLGTIWPIEAHTRAKHEILRRYLNAWLPIMSRNSRVLFIDGFAGPGRYEGGEDGSPIVALKAARSHKARLSKKNVFIFIEADADRFAHLKQIVDECRADLPNNIEAHCVEGRFDEKMDDIFVHLETQKKKMAPALVFVDPSGFSHTPFETIRRIMENPRCEVLINLMYEEINRFISHPDHEHTFDRLFGTDIWRNAKTITDPQKRRQTLHDIYDSQLRCRANARLVRSFQMINENNITDYFLFFATNEPLGLDRMKEAMWDVDPTGSYQFSDYATGKAMGSLLANNPADYEEMSGLLSARFAGSAVAIEQVLEFVIIDTRFPTRRVKSKVLAPMEAAGKLDVAGLRKNGTFPSGTIIRFR